jgi:death-on-curing protein
MERYITIQEALKIHSKGIQRYGGADGLRDKEGLEATLARPFAGFGDQELFPDAREKAAAMLQGCASVTPLWTATKEPHWLYPY